ncbi:hypothetical protein [Youngiibacter fragilis]|uniref:Uncharacterized protein n=1 Tax=Youngiibacter fragilis 232.1 TaxID=994573 RepID=V7I197_9CLOT|nr:hypothetical protein [Youngiibacter fragilis]ETA78969.1 hypothetical protein T472_0219620 [Youngiibacter fragilis 232.1]
MRYVYAAISVVSAILLLSTLICGSWIRYNNITDPGSLGFHMKLGTLSVLAGLVTSVLLLILSFRRVP